MTARGIRTNGSLNHQINEVWFPKNLPLAFFSQHSHEVLALVLSAFCMVYCTLTSSPRVFLAHQNTQLPPVPPFYHFGDTGCPRVILCLKKACTYKSVLLLSSLNRMGPAFWRKTQDLPPLSNLVDIQTWKAGLQSQKFCSCKNADKQKLFLALNLKYLYNF